jgi:hypothetical protein
LLAAEAERQWRAVAAGRPLRFVGGDSVLAFGTAFYLADRPQAYADFRVASPIDPARIARAGIVLLCVAEDRDCAALIRPLETASAAPRRIELELARMHLGVRGRPERYLVVVVPPRPN